MVQNRQFPDLVRLMTPDEQDILSKRMYKDFVIFESKDILSKLLEKTIFM